LAFGTWWRARFERDRTPSDLAAEDFDQTINLPKRATYEKNDQLDYTDLEVAAVFIDSGAEKRVELGGPILPMKA
jgi:hypothetical protein